MLISTLRRLPWLPVFIVLISAIFISAVFMYSRPVSHNEFYKVNGDSAGMVLGISEASAKYQMDWLYKNTNVLPRSEDISLIPEKNNESEEISLPACGNAAALDIGSGEVLFRQEADARAPIASITKLITALVFLDHNPGWDYVYKIKPSDRIEGGKIYLFTGEKVAVKDLFYLSLIGSANTATRALVSATGLQENDFVAKMNRKMREMELNHTKFVDPIGLNNFNISTALETAKFTAAALSKQEIREATLTKKHEFATIDGRKKIVYNTDILLDIFPQNGIKILGGKTGFTDLAGYCFTGRFTNADGHEIITVILGGQTLNSRFKQAKELAEWTYRNFKWPGAPDILSNAY